MASARITGVVLEIVRYQNATPRLECHCNEGPIQGLAVERFDSHRLIFPRLCGILLKSQTPLLVRQPRSRRPGREQASPVTNLAVEVQRGSFVEISPLGSRSLALGDRAWLLAKAVQLMLMIIDDQISLQLRIGQAPSSIYAESYLELLRSRV